MGYCPKHNTETDACSTCDDEALAKMQAERDSARSEGAYYRGYMAGRRAKAPPSGAAPSAHVAEFDCSCGVHHVVDLPCPSALSEREEIVGALAGLVYCADCWDNPEHRVCEKHLAPARAILALHRGGRS
jgi:hypothetical protein